MSFPNSPVCRLASGQDVVRNTTDRNGSVQEVFKSHGSGSGRAALTQPEPPDAPRPVKIPGLNFNFLDIKSSDLNKGASPLYEERVALHVSSCCVCIVYLAYVALRTQRLPQ